VSNLTPTNSLPNDTLSGERGAGLPSFDVQQPALRTLPTHWRYQLALIFDYPFFLNKLVLHPFSQVRRIEFEVGGGNKACEELDHNDPVYNYWRYSDRAGDFRSELF
jgi:hypothetical protein